MNPSQEGEVRVAFFSVEFLSEAFLVTSIEEDLPCDCDSSPPQPFFVQDGPLDKWNKAQIRQVGAGRSEKCCDLLHYIHKLHMNLHLFFLSEFVLQESACLLTTGLYIARWF